MSKFSTYDAAGPIDAAADILMVGQGTDEKVLKLVSPSNLVAAGLPANVARTTDIVKQFGGMCSGKATASEVIFSMFAPYAATLTAAMFKATATVAATASTTFVIRNGDTQIGTIVFAAGATTATISISNGAIALDDRLSITAPATADATLANITYRVKVA